MRFPRRSEASPFPPASPCASSKRPRRPARFQRGIRPGADNQASVRLEFFGRGARRRSRCRRLLQIGVRDAGGLVRHHGMEQRRAVLRHLQGDAVGNGDARARQRRRGIAQQSRAKRGVRCRAPTMSATCAMVLVALVMIDGMIARDERLAICSQHDGRRALTHERRNCECTTVRRGTRMIMTMPGSE